MKLEVFIAISALPANQTKNRENQQSTLTESERDEETKDFVFFALILDLCSHQGHTFDSTMVSSLYGTCRNETTLHLDNLSKYRILR
jgi:hypothetical protein